ncbi:MAG: efflux RND transporter periplasmic adaptor subunit, partial [Planctomycetota bacterium]
IVRSRAAGFVTRVCVGDGELVTAGQLLLELSNKELESEQRELELALEQGKLRCRIALDEQEVAEVQVAERDMQAVAERLEEVQRRTAGLRVLAPASGRVIGRNLDQRIGSYLREGTEVLAIGDEQRKELIVSVGQQEVDAILLLVGEPARFRVGGRAARQGRLERLEPRASTELPHPALSSAVGGPLAVTASDKSQQTKLRLAEPRFRGVIALVPGQATDLGAGERGYALLGLRRESVGEYVWLRFSGWLESLLVPEQS